MLCVLTLNVYVITVAEVRLMLNMIAIESNRVLAIGLANIEGQECSLFLRKVI